MSRILIADDHHFLREGLVAVLVAAGLEVVGTVADGMAALAEIARLDPDLVILDVTMPELDGIAVLASLRATGDQRRVILLTAHITDSQLVAALEVGVNGIIGKQVGSKELLEGIEIVSRGGQLIPPEMISRALNIAKKLAQPSPLAMLNSRERQVADAAGQGMRNRAIAELMNASEGAIKITLHRIYDKLGVGNRTELARIMQEFSD